MDVRHQRRIEIVKLLFPYGFKNSEKILKDQNNPTVNKIFEDIEKIDKTIIKYAPKYPIDKISKIDLAILRLSIYEMIIDKKNPYKVIIDEAVELAKEYGNEKSYLFINGVLGALINNID
jgi:N utilization substance protein B